MAHISNSALVYAEECHSCFEKFALLGIEPVVLSCGHSLCEKCAEDIEEQRAVCSECQEKVTTDKITEIEEAKEEEEKDKEEGGEKENPPKDEEEKSNKNHIPVEREKKPTKKMEMCKRHDREITFFCNNPDCQKEICQICILEEHKKHEFLDLKNLQEEKRRILLVNTEALKKDIQTNKAKLLDTKEEMTENLNTCTKKIQEEKRAKIESVTRIVTDKYDQLLQSVTHIKTEEIDTIDKDVKIFDQQISELKDIETNMEGEGSKKLDEIMNKNKLFNDVVEKTKEKSGPRSYKNFDHREKQVTKEEVENLCGNVEERLKEILMFTTLNSHLLVSASQLKCSGNLLFFVFCFVFLGEGGSNEKTC